MVEVAFYLYAEVGVIVGAGRGAALHRIKEKFGIKLAACSYTRQVVSVETFPYLYISLCGRCWARPYRFARLDEDGVSLFTVEQLALAFDAADG